MPKTMKQLKEMKAAGERIAGTPGHVQATAATKWNVYSETARRIMYVVVLGVKGLACDCPQGEFGKGLCKHVVAVDSWLARRWAALHKRGESRISRPSPRCPNCPSRKIVRDGRRPTKRKGLVQKYLCRRCGTRFSGLPGLKGRHASPGVIADALSQVSNGTSLAKVANELSRKGNDFSRSTIHRWAVAYGSLMAAYARECRPWVGYRWHCDEVWFRVRKGDAYLFAVMDYSTRFVLSSMVSPVKFGVEPLGMFVEAARLAGTVPWVFVTDGLREFRKPAKKAFWRRAGRRLVHVIEIHMQNEFNHNNVHESFNGNIKPLLEVRGGFQSDSPAMAGLAILAHNFFRPHTALDGRTPAEAAGILVDGPDRVLTLLEAAAAWA